MRPEAGKMESRIVNNADAIRMQVPGDAEAAAILLHEVKVLTEIPMVFRPPGQRTGWVGEYFMGEEYARPGEIRQKEFGQGVDVVAIRGAQERGKFLVLEKPDLCPPPVFSVR